MVSYWLSFWRLNSGRPHFLAAPSEPVSAVCWETNAERNETILLINMNENGNTHTH